MPDTGKVADPDLFDKMDELLNPSGPAGRNGVRQYFCLAVLVVPAPVAAQDPLQDLYRRVEALERENTSLKQDIARLSGRDSETVLSLPTAVRAPPPVSQSTMPPPHDEPRWRGAYVGVNAGVNEARFDFTPISFSVPSSHATSTDPAFGSQIGYRWQSGALVTGIGLDLSFPQDSVARLPTVSSVGRVRLPFEMKWNARVAGQIGFAAGPLLAYGTAGLQVSRIHYATAPGNRDGSFYTTDGNPSALFYGFGVGALLADGLSLELEATQADFGLLPGDYTKNGRSRGLMLRLNQQLK